MKKLLFIILASLIGASVWASAHVSMPGDDDLFPWPWGTECPFPWQQIEGIYEVKAVKGGPHSGHYLQVHVKQVDNSGIEFLSLTEFDRLGLLYATGQGYTQENERIVKGLLKENKNSKPFTVMVRSYARDVHASCTSDLVTAVTFCPLHGKKCMTEPNYILERR